MSESRRSGEKGRGMLQEVFGEMPLPRARKAFDTGYEDYWTERIETGVLTAPAVRRAAGVLPFISDGDTVLDVGCGTGDTLSFLAQRRHINGTGLDISETALESVREKGFSTVHADLTRDGASLDGHYDHILLFEVIEHVIDAETLVGALSGHFRKGLYITTPNLGYVAHRLRLLTGRFPVTYISDPREHLRYWSTRDFRTWCEWTGLGRPQVIGLKGKAGFLARIHPSLFASEVLYRLTPRI